MSLPIRVLIAMIGHLIGLQSVLDSTVAPQATAPAAGITNEVAKLTASDASAGDVFGFAVAVDGDTMIVGARANDVAGSSSGAAYVFQRNAGGADRWGQVAKLTAADAAAGDQFGLSVSISGGAAVVGARGSSDAGADSGSLYVFGRDVGGVDRWGQVAKLTASDAADDDRLGMSVSISRDTLIAGARFDDDAGAESGSAYAISGDTAVVGAVGNDDGATDSGSAYVLERNAGTADGWGLVVKLTPPDPAVRGQFGNSVSISGDTLVVGAFHDDEGGTRAGAAYVFGRNVGGDG